MHYQYDYMEFLFFPKRNHNFSIGICCVQLNENSLDIFETRVSFISIVLRTASGRLRRRQLTVVYQPTKFPSITISSRIGLEFTPIVITSDLKKTRSETMLSCQLCEYCCRNFGHLHLTERRFGLVQDWRTGVGGVQIASAAVDHRLDLLVCTPIGNWVARTKLLNQ